MSDRRNTLTKAGDYSSLSPAIRALFEDWRINDEAVSLADKSLFRNNPSCGVLAFVQEITNPEDSTV